MSQTQNIIGYVARNRKTDQYGAYSYAVGTKAVDTLGKASIRKTYSTAKRDAVTLTRYGREEGFEHWEPCAVVRRSGISTRFEILEPGEFLDPAKAADLKRDLKKWRQERRDRQDGTAAKRREEALWALEEAKEEAARALFETLMAE